MLEIVTIDKEGALLNAAKELILEYQRELNENLCFQDTGKELENPLVKYGAPHGCLLLALYNGGPAGCVAIQPIAPGVCEMKRLYVKPAFRKHKLGLALSQAIIGEAQKRNYHTMKLDTLERLQPAIKLYEQLGFTQTGAYYHNPLTGVVYMEINLGNF